MPSSLARALWVPCPSLFPLHRRHFLRCVAVVDQLLCPPDTSLGPGVVRGVAVVVAVAGGGGDVKAGDMEDGGAGRLGCGARRSVPQPPPYRLGRSLRPLALGCAVAGDA